MDTDDWTVFAFLASIVLFMGVIGWTEYKYKKEHNWCEQQGGYQVKTDRGWHCFEMKEIVKEQEGA